MPGRKERKFAGDPRSPAHARSFAKDAVGAILTRSVPPTFCDDVELVVSELVTNAVRAGSASVRVTLEHSDGGIVLIQVADQATGWPEPRAAGMRDPGGRGLSLVTALSRRWGVRADGDGKVVWAELALPAA